jgi:zinc protease
MRGAKRWLSLFVGAAFLSAVGCQQPQQPEAVPRVEIPVTKQPGRATNDDMAFRVPSDREPRPRATPQPKEGVTIVEGTAVAQADTKPQEQPVAKEQPANEKPGATPTVEDAPAPASRPAKSTGETEVAASQPAGYGAETYRLVNQSDEIVSVLKNGMVVIAKRVPSPVTSVRGYVNTGGVYEGKWLGGGLSHLLEHLVAGGSSQRRTEAQNRDLLQKIGNNSNAYTSSDHTAYFINTTGERLNEAVDLVTGWMFGALITPDEYKREYEVVQRELEKDKGEPDWVMYLLSEANRYRISPARVPVIGYQEVIQGLSRDDVFNYYKLAYIPNNMIFSVTGDLPAEQMLRAVQDNVVDVKPGRDFERNIAPEPPVLAPRTSVATFPKLGQAKLQLGFPSIRMDSPDLFAVDLLATVLGGGESSLLVEELRDKRRIVNAVAAGNPTPTYVEGTFQIDMELDPDKIAAATEAALGILDGVIKDGLPADRIERAKVQMRTARVKSLQSSESIASSLATDFINTGDPHFTDRYIKRIEEVTPEQLQAAAKKYFVRNALLTTALLPAEYVGAGGLPKAEDVLRPVAPTTKESPVAPDAKPQVTRLELPNGTILLHKRIATSPLVEVRMYSLGGLSAEDAKSNGIGNLTMKMLPRGTKTRSAQQIASFFDSIGGDFDTQSGNNSWGWSATCLKGDFDKTMDVFADVVNNPAFPDAEVEQMKQRVAAQIESQDADWHQQAMRFARSKFFGPKNSPYQFVAIGTKDNLGSFNREQMQKFYADNVLQGRRVVAVYGDIELEKAKAVVTEKLGSGEKIKNLEAPTTQMTASDEARGGAKITPAVNIQRVEINPTQQPLAGVVIMYESDSFLGDADNFPIVVGDCMSSGYGYPTGYLHEILRGLGYVYVVHAINFPGRSKDVPGNFLVYAGCDPNNVTKVVDIILENIARLQGSNKDMQEGWFDRSKQLITTNDAMDNETPAEQAQTAALDELMGLGYAWHDQFASRVNEVKQDQVRRVAAKRLVNAVVTISTPAPDAVKIEPGKRTYKTFPPVDLTPRGVQHDSK